MRKEKRYKKAKKSLFKNNLRFLFAVFSLGFLFLSIANFFILSNFSLKPKKGLIEKSMSSPLAKNQTKIASFHPTNIPFPTPTSSPFPTIEPTQVPPSGFCLKVPVLMYHHVQPAATAKEKGQSGLSVDNGIFDQQINYLVSQGYSVVTPRQLIDALKTHGSLPNKSIVVTLDDGYRDVYLYAYPVLQKYHIQASLALPTGLMEGADYLTWSQVEEMGRGGLISFMNHTWSHYSLGKADVDKIKFEIETAKQQLEQHGQQSNIFVYPYGSLADKVIEVLQQDGFTGAFSTIPGFYQCDSFILSLHRTRIGNASLPSYGL